jgi:hypothetical protein
LLKHERRYLLASNLRLLLALLLVSSVSFAQAPSHQSHWAKATFLGFTSGEPGVPVTQHALEMGFKLKAPCITRADKQYVDCTFINNAGESLDITSFMVDVMHPELSRVAYHFLFERRPEVLRQIETENGKGTPTKYPQSKGFVTDEWGHIEDGWSITIGRLRDGKFGYASLELMRKGF